MSSSRLSLKLWGSNRSVDEIDRSGTPAPARKRLSKPPTNIASNAHSKVAQRVHPDSYTRRPSVPENDESSFVNTYQTDHHRSRSDAREKLRSHLFGGYDEYDNSTQEALREGEYDLLKRRGSEFSGAKEKISRTGSFMSLPSARSSLTHLASATGSRTSLARYSRSPEYDEAANALQQVRDKVSADSMATWHHASSSVIIEEESSNHIPPAPIRRRSLMTPGLATRVPDDAMRRPSAPQVTVTQADMDYYYNPNLSESSPLSRLAGLDLADDGRSTPNARCSTPQDLDYSHLGGLKRGTLCITNGRASPSPSIVGNSPLPTLPHPQIAKPKDYFSLARNQINNANTFHHVQATGSERIRGADGCMSVEQSSDRSLQLQQSGNMDGAQFHSRKDGNCSNEGASPAAATASGSDGIQQRRGWNQSPSINVSIGAPERISMLAQDYISELPSSPFSYTKSPVPSNRSFEATTKKDDDDDHLFDDEGIVTTSSEEGMVEALREIGCARPAGPTRGLSREDAFDALNGTPPSKAYQGTGSAIPTRLSWDNVPSADQNSKTPPLLSKADSGYSSNTSIRSLRRSSSDEKRTYRTARAVSMVQESPEVEELATASRAPNTRGRSMASMSSRHSILKKQNSNKPIIATLIPATVSHEDSSESTKMSIPRQPSISRIVSVKDKFKKRRPQSQPPPATVLAYRGLDAADIPPVPSVMLSKHNQRLQDFPSLEKTYANLVRGFSGDSEDEEIPEYVEIRFPSPTPSDEVAEQKTKSKRSKSPKPSVSHRSGHATKSTKLDKLANQPINEAELVKALTDFGTVAESLGRSPYDIARSSTVQPQRTRSPEKANLQPHSISTAMPRAKSMNGLDAAAAAELARLRSRNLAEANEGCSQRAPSVSSQHRRQFNDRGGVPGKQLRPTSFFLDAPPVPALPTFLDVQKREEQITKANAERSLILMPSKNAVQKTSEGAKRQSILRSSPNSSTRSVKSNDDNNNNNTMNAESAENIHPLPDVPTSNTQPLPHRPVPDRALQLELIEKRKAFRRSMPANPQRLRTGDANKLLADQNRPPNTPSPGGSPTPPIPQPSRDPWEAQLKAWSAHRSAASAQSFTSPTHSRLSSSPHREASPLGTTSSTITYHSATISSTTTISTAQPSVVSVSSTKTPPSVSGRYDGGYEYGYEAGHGIGGSAGTRNRDSVASRKSVDLSRGYGVDLSDIPVFLTRDQLSA